MMRMAIFAETFQVLAVLEDGFSEIRAEAEAKLALKLKLEEAAQALMSPVGSSSAPVVSIAGAATTITNVAFDAAKAASKCTS
jgi:hypothetical protein